MPRYSSRTVRTPLAAASFRLPPTTATTLSERRVSSTTTSWRRLLRALFRFRACRPRRQRPLRSPTPSSTWLPKEHGATDSLTRRSSLRDELSLHLTMTVPAAALSAAGTVISKEERERALLPPRQKRAPDTTRPAAGQHVRLR